MRSNVLTHEQLVKKLLRRPGVRKEVERIERQEAGTASRVKTAPAYGKHQAAKRPFANRDA